MGIAQLAYPSQETRRKNTLIFIIKSIQPEEQHELSVKSDFTFSCFISTKSLQEIIPNKKNKIKKNITEKNSYGYKEIDESQEAEILLSKTASKQLMETT